MCIKIKREIKLRLKHCKGLRSTRIHKFKLFFHNVEYTFNFYISTVLNSFKNSTFIQRTRQFWVIDSSRSPLEKTYLFFPNDKVYGNFNYNVIFPNLLAACNLILAVETWLTDAVITKRLTAPLPEKVKMTKIVYMPLLKLLSEAIISAKHVLITY